MTGKVILISMCTYRLLIQLLNDIDNNSHANNSEFNQTVAEKILKIMAFLTEGDLDRAIKFYIEDNGILLMRHLFEKVINIKITFFSCFQPQEFQLESLREYAGFLAFL